MKEKVLSKIEGRIKKVELLRSTYGLGLRETMRVWEVVGRPVMEYGAEVWASNGWTEGEKVLMRLGKRLIGMRRNTNQEVVQGELGLWRMKGRWDLARLRLWKKLVEGKNKLASWVYQRRRDEFERGGRQDRGNWCWYTWQVLKSIDREMEWEVEHTEGAHWIKEMKEAIKKREEKEWRARVAMRPRLRTYRLVKDKLEFEVYLECTSGKRRKALLEMRSGANDLEIERGRRRRVEVQQRVCEECNQGVEDEIHLVLECKAYAETRRKMLWRLEELGTQVHGEDREATWRNMMKGARRRTWRVIGKYVARMLAERERRREERAEIKDTVAKLVAEIERKRAESNKSSP
jgi:hypothetical protein